MPLYNPASSGSGVSGLTATRVPFAASATELIDDADMTFDTDTLTVAKIVINGASGNTLIVDTNSLVVDASNGYVGIGTATPESVFHVNAGSARSLIQIDDAGALSPLNLWNSNAGAAAGAGMLFTAGADETLGSNFIGGMLARRIDDGDDDTSFLALRVLANGALTNATETASPFLVKGMTDGTTRAVFNTAANVKLVGNGTLATRGTTEGTNHLDIFNGTAPVGTLTNGVSLYSSSGELYGMNASGVAKQITGTPRTNTVTSSATPTINVDTTDIFTITALATNITSMTTNLSGTPVNGQKLIIRILDNGTARTITWGASYVSRGATLPTTTVLSKYTYVGLIYNSTASKWDCVAAVTET